MTKYTVLPDKNTKKTTIVNESFKPIIILEEFDKETIRLEKIFNNELHKGMIVKPITLNFKIIYVILKCL